MAGVTLDLLLLAGVAGLEDAHEVSMVALLLALAAPGDGVGDVLAVSSEDLHAREVREVSGRGGGLGGLLRGSTGLLCCWAHRGSRGLRRRAVEAQVGHDGGDIVGGLRGGGRGDDGVVLEVLASLAGVLEEVHGDGGSLLLGGAGTREVSADELLKLLGADGGQKLQGGAEGRLVDAEALDCRGGSRHVGHCYRVMAEALGKGVRVQVLMWDVVCGFCGVTGHALRDDRRLDLVI